MKNKKEKEKSLMENFENFIHSDSAAAVATKLILATVALGGVAIGGAIIPGIIKSIKAFDSKGDFSNKKIQNSFYALKRRKFIKIIKRKDGKIIVSLTNKGKRKMLEFAIEGLKIDKPKKWDRKWRVLIFDIPVKMNSAREALRKKIKELGFYQFQGSVWFYPYPCEDEILAMAEFFKTSEYIEIMTVERVLHEKELKKYFKLK
ncbi:MAG: hypothetical protein RBS77_05235 [Candidatus Moranbacteria bacterium]|jgi:DNA-binding transcriptional regulator PaaX|nr:hypothetical protein [Candidatus Moranbacteria bacterium]